MFSRFCLGWVLLFTAIQAKDITPTFRMHASGVVTDFVIDGTRLYAGTDMGRVDIFDLNSKKIVSQITLEPILTGRGELVPPRVQSVDRFNGKTLIVSAGTKAFRNVYVHENGVLTKTIDESKELVVKEARFIDDERIMMGTFGAEMILYDTQEKFQAYKSHVSQSTFGDIALSEDHKKMIMSDESGSIRLIDIESSNVEQVLSSENLDNVYKVAYSSGVIITGGQDRKVGVYQLGKKAYHIKSDFLVYSVALSPSGKLGAYSSGADSKLQIFHTSDGRKTDCLIGHYAVVNTIKFMNEKELFSSGDEEDIFYWKLD
ncbi:MAG: WD40 repeat domain-containing protein [Campylobacterota bacterium]|nr:WD40 repeat domain-containing protein [Campylobacterota bacterium]